MILSKPGEAFDYNGYKYVVGEEVIGTSKSEYENLIGHIIEIRADGDAETENETPDIYCRFDSPVSPYEIQRLEHTFSALYGQPKKLCDLPLDCVIMAPEMIYPTKNYSEHPASVPVYLLKEQWADKGENDCAFRIYLDKQEAKYNFFKTLAELFKYGDAVPNDTNDMECDCGAGLYRVWAADDYINFHYEIRIEKRQLKIPRRVFDSVGMEWYRECKNEDFNDRLDEMADGGSITEDQHKKLRSCRCAAELIDYELGHNSEYWTSYQTCVSEAIRKLLHKEERSVCHEV